MEPDVFKKPDTDILVRFEDDVTSKCSMVASAVFNNPKQSKESTVVELFTTKVPSISIF